MRYIKINKEKAAQVCVGINSTLEEVVKNLDWSGLQIVLVLNVMGRLVGTITDGDIRRALLRGVALGGPASVVMNSSPQYIEEGDSLDRKLLSIKPDSRVIHLPILDFEGRVVGMFLSEQFEMQVKIDNLVVIMAGGAGKRMRPLTENCPKAMLQIGEKPILEHVLDRFIGEGYVNFCFSVHYMAEMIKMHFEDGAKWGVNISYINESTPLGTAGALALLSRTPDGPILVTNCDVLTDIRCTHLLNYHLEHKAVATMAVREYEWTHPFGVVELVNQKIVSIVEKPTYRSYVNAGIYVLDPKVLDEIEKNSYLDMTDLFSALNNKDMLTVAYPTHEYWFDVGRPADFHIATERILKGK